MKRFRIDGCGGNVMGNGYPDRCAERNRPDQRQNLGLIDPFKPCDRGIMAVLLRGASAGRSVQGYPIDKMSVVITPVLAFVFLHEQFTAKSLLGALLLAAGTLVMVP